MKFKIFNIEISISVLFCILISFLLIIDTTGLMAVSLITVLIHEFGHLVCMKYYRCSPKALKLSFYGVFIVSPSVYSSVKEKVVVAASGPFANLLLLLILLIINLKTKSKFISWLIISNFAFFFINMFPINELDGGTICKSFLKKLLGNEKGNKVFQVISCLFIIIIFFLGVTVFLNGAKNPTLLLLGIYLFVINILKY